MAFIEVAFLHCRSSNKEPQHNYPPLIREPLLALEGSYPIVMAINLGAFFATSDPGGWDGLGLIRLTEVGAQSNANQLV